MSYRSLLKRNLELIVMEMMKKFRLKIVHYSEDYYTIYYSYWYIPIWKQLYQFIDISENMYKWNPVLGKINKIELIASHFKNIEDIINYNKSQKEICSTACKKYDKYWNKAIPYKTKSII